MERIQQRWSLHQGNRRSVRTRIGKFQSEERSDSVRIEYDATTFVPEVELAESNTVEQFVQGNVAGNNGVNYENQILWSKSDNYELRACIMYDKVITFDQTNGSVCSKY